MNIGKDFFSRHGDDNVYTPYSMIDQFLEKEDFDYNKSFCEPACGNGAIVKVLKNKTSNVFYSDIKKNNKDFLKQKEKFDYFITNLPYSIWDQFIEKAKEITNEKFAFLGRMEFLTEIKRYEQKIYNSNGFQLLKMYIFVRKGGIRFFNKEKELEILNNKLKNCDVRKEKAILKLIDKTKKKNSLSKIKKRRKISGRNVSFLLVCFW